MTQDRTITRLQRYCHQPGTAPGTLVNPPAGNPGEYQMRVIRYTADSFSEELVAHIDDLPAKKGGDQVTWINVEGHYDAELLQALGNHYGLHALSLEDTLNRGHRPKLEEYQDYLFIVLYLLPVQANMAADQQVSIFLADNLIITLETAEFAAFDLLRQRLRYPQSGDDIRNQGGDYLTYAICDTLVDQFFPRLESYREQLDRLETRLLANPARELLEEIHQIKMSLLVLGRIAWAERDVIAGLERHHPHLGLYLRDSYDHVIQVIEVLETYRDITTGILDIYLSSVSNQMNSVMKTLTIIATIFIPLTFIVGVYGMNFNPAASPFNMPELNAYYAYPIVWIIMLGIALGMLSWFRRKKWL